VRNTLVKRRKAARRLKGRRLSAVKQLLGPKKKKGRSVKSRSLEGRGRRSHSS
jgi:hypothetical protein